MRQLYYLSLLFLSTFILSCGLQKQVDLKLPNYDGQIMVECYLTPGAPYYLTLTESVSYSAGIALPPTVDSALVIVKHGSISDTLKFNPDTNQYTKKFYNYISASLVPADYASEFNLIIIDKKGRVATASTHIQTPVSIDTIIWKYSSSDSTAFPVTQITDNQSTSDFYRFVVTRTDSIDIANGSIVDYETDDKLFQTSKIDFGGPYKLKKGDSVLVSVYHISQDYYNFLESVNNAQNANGNPFAQPSLLKSNISGGIGIFTGFSADARLLGTP